MDAWIIQLSSDDWKVRQSAMEKLVGLGEDALPRLNLLADTTNDGEVRTRAAAAIGQIEENRLVGASLITLNLKDVSPMQAFAELARQAHAPLYTDPPNLLSQKNTRLVSQNVDHEPYWSVLQKLSAQCELEVTGITRRSREIGLGLTRGNADWMDKPIALSGPLLIRADRLTRISTARLKGAKDVSQEFNISLTAFAEPKLKVMDYSGAIKLEEVVDDRGNSLIPTVDNNAVAANVDVFGNTREGNTSHWEIGATLHYPKGVGTRIARFRASTALQVRTRSAVLDMPVAGARNAARTVGGLRIIVKALDANRCDLSVFRDGRNDADWYAVRMQLSAGEAQLQDDKGRVMARSQTGLETDETRDGLRMELRIRFGRETPDEGERNKDAKQASASEASRLVWEFPMEIRELRVPFEFRDLPIP